MRLPLPALLRIRSRPAAVLALLVLIGAIRPGAAQGIPYTIQVVALSDQNNALALQQQLLIDGFPAYVVRTATAQGSIYRVRVGAFANREAALAYAEHMPEIGGVGPIPALAEFVPEGIMPLQPRLLVRFPAVGVELRVLPWRETVAVRVQSRAPPEPARYYVAEAGDGFAFEAWRAVPAGEGEVLQVRNLDLWPEDWQEASAEAREAFRQSLLTFVATNLSLPVAEVAALEVVTAAGSPALMILEQSSPLASDVGRILAVGVPAEVAEPFGPSGFVGFQGEGEVDLVPLLDPLYTLDPEGVGQPSLEQGAWIASADGDFVRVEIPEQGIDWRAAVGTPLWSRDRFLLTRSGDAFLLYELLPR